MSDDHVKKIIFVVENRKKIVNALLNIMKLLRKAGGANV